MQVDQSIESYDWIVPIGSVQGIIRQLQVLRKSMESEKGARSSVMEGRGTEC